MPSDATWHPQNTLIFFAFLNKVVLNHLFTHLFIHPHSLTSSLFIPSSASLGGNGGLQAAGGGGTAVSERPPAARGGSGQSADLSHSSDSAARGQSTAAHHHPAVQHPAGRGQPSYYKCWTHIVSISVKKHSIGLNVFSRKLKSRRTILSEQLVSRWVFESYSSVPTGLLRNACVFF